jgi:diguanylate cyclase (GGDEF)-like protein/PAS domain S-box-containing protein
VKFPDTFFENLVDNLYDGVYFVDPTRKILYWNQGAERITGYSREEMLGRYCPDNILQHVDSTGRALCLVGCPLTRAIHDGVAREEEIYLRHKEGHRVPVLVKSSPIRGEEGRIIGAVEIFSDNSRHKDASLKAQAMERQAMMDVVTGLGNRRYCEKMLEGMLEEQKRRRKSFGVLMADIDLFKAVNDTFGHDVGDEVLRMVAKTLSNNMRGLDYLGRWGGEEFLLLVSDVDEEVLFFVAERCRALVEKSYLSSAGRNIKVTISVGGTLSHPKDDTVTVVKRADESLYVSKERGRNRVTIDAGKPT